MYYIISQKSGRIHREPNKKPWASTSYKSAGAAKAGITRTIKFYQAAIDEVAEVVKSGKSEFYARRYNAFRDATDPVLGRTHCFDINNYKVVAVEDYVEPQITRTGRCPYDGRTITVTLGINEVGTHMDPLCESHWTN